MTNLILKNNFFILFLLALLVVPLFYLNAALVPCGHCEKFGVTPSGQAFCQIASPGVTAEEAEPCQLCHFLVLGQRIIKFLTQLGTALAIIAVLYGGFFLLTSAGSPERITKGKEALWTALKGIILVYSSWLILNTLLLVLQTGGTSGSGIARILSRPWAEITTCS